MMTRLFGRESFPCDGLVRGALAPPPDTPRLSAEIALPESPQALTFPVAAGLPLRAFLARSRAAYRHPRVRPA